MLYYIAYSVSIDLFDDSDGGMPYMIVIKIDTMRVFKLEDIIVRSGKCQVVIIAVQSHSADNND